VSVLDLSGNGVSRAILHVPRWGVPMADVWMLDAPKVIPGARVVLTLGDLAIVGTLLPGGTFGGTADYTVVGGAGGWHLPVPSRSYSDSAAVKFPQVVTDLVRAAGEDRDGAPVLGASISLGVTWTRPATLARDALDAISPHPPGAPNMGGQWWVARDGVTHIGPRVATACAPVAMSIMSYDPAMKRATVALADDTIAQLYPGATVTAPWEDNAPASTLLVGSMTVRAEPGGIEVDLFGEKGSAELLADLVAALTAYTRWHAAYPMQVTSTTGAMVNVDPLNALAAALPGLPGIPQWFGVPGVTATLAKGAPVGVSFLGGSPGGAAVTSYGPGVLPSGLAINATALSLGGPLGSGSPVLVDTLGVLTTFFGAVVTALTALGHPVTAPTGYASTTTKAVP